MPVFARKAGVLREADKVYYRDNGVLRTADKMWRRENGVLREVFTSTITQVIPLPTAGILPRNLGVVWTLNIGSRLQINAPFSGGQPRFLARLVLTRDSIPPGAVRVDLADSNTQAGTNSGVNFSTDFKNRGSITVAASDGTSFTAALSEANSDEPYDWVPTSYADVISTILAVESLADTTGTLTLSLPPS